MRIFEKLTGGFVTTDKSNFGHSEVKFKESAQGLMSKIMEAESSQSHPKATGVWRSFVVQG